MAMTISKRITLGFSATLAVITCVGGFTYTQLRTVEEDVAVVASEVLPGLYYSGQMPALVSDNFGRSVRHIVAQTKPDMDALEKEMAATSAKLDAVYKSYEAGITLPEDRQLFDRVIAARAPYTSARKEMMKLSLERKTQEAEQAINAKVVPAHAKYAEALNELATWNKARGQTAAASTADAVQAADIGLFVGVGGALAISGILGFIIVRSTNKALGRIAGTLGDGSSQVASGVQITGEVAKMLEEITAASTKVNSLIEEIAAASREQSTGIEQVNTAVGQMDKVTQSSAANAEEGASAAEELSSQAEQMAGVVRDLVKLVGGKSAGDATGVTSNAGKLSTASSFTPSNDTSEDFNHFSRAA